MIYEATPLKGSYVIKPEWFEDERGSFARYFCLDEFSQIGHIKPWVQLNHSKTKAKGSLRGMHFQRPPYSEIKMVKCIRGSVYDVIIDIRKNSETFLKYFGTELSEENGKMMYIPEGFAHGFQCLTDNCELLYHHSEYYQPGVEGGIRFNDASISIQWPLEPGVLSVRDASHSLIDLHFKGI